MPRWAIVLLYIFAGWGIILGVLALCGLVLAYTGPAGLAIFVVAALVSWLLGTVADLMVEP